MNYDTVIGLETHVQLGTKSKIFCACSTQFGAQANANTCPICLGLPGSLPVLNERALELAIRAALALSCEIAERLKFDRKNYFYPDLPKAYQISQYDMPVSFKGHVVIPTASGEKTIGITRAHLEEDAGKLLHEGVKQGSLVDYNRCGVPLLEIVTEPDICSSEEAHTYLTTLKAILEYVAVSNCNMEEGSLRCDANVSLKPAGAKELGTRCEIKNMNSFSAVRRAIDYEIKRQREQLAEGKKITQETRLWDEKQGVTYSMRSKEEAHDYRYFPEPDLVPFTISRSQVETIRRELPELPRARAKRFETHYGLTPYDAAVLTQERRGADFFEVAVKDGVEAKQVANWMQNDLLGVMNARKLTFATLQLTPQPFADMLKLIHNGTISGKIAKEILPSMIDSGKSAEAVIQEHNLAQVVDSGLLESLADKVIAAHPQTVTDFKNGKKQSVGFLVGQLMKETKGKANPQLANKILQEKLAQQ